MRSRALVALGIWLALPSPVLAAGGDRCETATVIPALPFVDTGDTRLFLDDYAPACPSGYVDDTIARDTVYRYTPPQDETVTISLCGSVYDTKLYVYEGSCPADPHDQATLLACSDDDCFGGPDRYLASHLDGLPLSGAVTYYIVIDGYKLDAGRYVLTVSSSALCADCGPGATIEDEPNCGLDDTGQPDDFVNGGCNGPGPLFMPIAPGETICGTTAVNADIGARDTDWYELVLTQVSEVTWAVSAEFRMLLGIVDNGGVPDCAEARCFLAFTQAAACQEKSVSRRLPPGTWWLYVAPFFQDEGTCEFGYAATVTVRPAADLDGDGTVGPMDFELLMADWGPCPTYGPCPADLDGDSMVGVTDFLILLASWTR